MCNPFINDIIVILPSTKRHNCDMKWGTLATVIRYAEYPRNFFGLHNVISPCQPKRTSRLVCGRIEILEKILIDPSNLGFDL